MKKYLTITPFVIKAFRTFNYQSKKYKIYLESEKYYILPRFYGIKHFGSFKNIISNGDDMNTDVKFEYDLKPYQLKAYKTTYNQLNSSNSSNSLNKGGGVLSLPCGYGKTIIAIKLSIDFHGKTLIIVNKECLMEQWKNAILQFTNNKATIGIIQRDVCQINNDFVIAMIHTLSKKTYPHDFFKSFRMCVIDECHHLGSEIFSQVLLKIACKYMLGLSATPKRKDGLSNVFYYFLGELCYSEKRSGANQILVKQILCTCSTNEYNDVYTSCGNKDTIAMITQLINISRRNELIVAILESLLKEDRKIILLSDRRSHLIILKDLIQKHNIKNFKGDIATCGLYCGNNGEMGKEKHKQYLKDSSQCNIILGTYHIASEGLDIPDLNTAILASPKTDVEQSVGRILRKYHDIPPIVIDIVDNFGNFKKHSKLRQTFYESENYLLHLISINLDNSINYESIDTYISQRNKYTKSTKNDDNDESTEDDFS